MPGLSGQCLFVGDLMCSWEVPKTRGSKAFRKAQVLLGSSRSWVFIATFLWRVPLWDITFPAAALWL